jgi:hypothetical protein
MERTFSGGIFSDELDDGRAGADIELLPSGVCACSTEGEAFVIPFRDCQIEIGGFSGRMVFCRNADRSVTIFCEDREFPSALSLASWGTLDAQLGESLRRRRGESRRERMIGTAVAIGILALMVAGYVGIRVGARAAVKALPTSVDRR